MSALREHLSLLALALQRATVLRVGRACQDDAQSVRASDAHLPAAGWVVGLAACLVFALLGVLLRSSPWGAWVAAIVASIVTALLTRARAETALFRAAERLHGFAGAGPSGAGDLVLVLLLAAKWGLLATLASLSEAAVIASLFAAQAVTRLAPLLLARSLGGDVPARAVQIAAAWCIVPLLAVFLAAGLPALVLAAVAAVLACYGVWRLARVQDEGGDLLAASQQVCEVAFYLGAAVGL